MPYPIKDVFSVNFRTQGNHDIKEALQSLSEDHEFNSAAEILRFLVESYNEKQPASLSPTPTKNSTPKWSEETHFVADIPSRDLQLYQEVRGYYWEHSQKNDTGIGATVMRLLLKRIKGQAFVIVPTAKALQAINEVSQDDIDKGEVSNVEGYLQRFVTRYFYELGQEKRNKKGRHNPPHLR
ncbi:MAG: hypothetical protein AAFW00_19755 [Bacteroidota bacterium]